MSKTVAVIQARMSSTRLPGKVLKDLGGKPTLQWCIEAAMAAPGVDEVVVATSTLDSDNPVADFARDLVGVTVFRGDLTDVLSRFLGAATVTKADILVRLTGDCPLLDPQVIGEVIQLRRMKGAEYATNTDPPSYPDGLDVEVFTRRALECAHREATRGSDRDTVTRWMVRNRHRFPAANLVCPLPGLVKERWVLDSPEDYEFLGKLIALLPRGRHGYLDILRVLDGHPYLREINGHYTRNERFYDGMLADMGGKRSYATSSACLVQAESLIPLGAQTFSKSKLQFPEGAAPLFVTHGDGGYAFDVDGNDYIDLVGSLLPNILGHRDPDVDEAIRDQLARGSSHSLATTLETDLAERLNLHIPSAEMVRFGKNGSDVTTAAIRLARHITGRDKVMVGGYHGWHDWSMSVTDRDNGIPAKVGALSYKGPWAYDGSPMTEMAAVIIEPEFYSVAELEGWRKNANKNGFLLIFDEIISGFRCGLGGLQKEHGVTPDLSTFGKAMGNGMPISALVGLSKFMSRMPEISYSGTFFGETLSIAASIATIDKMQRLRVPEYLRGIGLTLRGSICTLIEKHGLTEKIELYGPIELNRIKFQDKTVQSLFIQEMAKQGILIIGSHNTCYAHKTPEINKIINAWDKVLAAIAGGAQLEGGVIKGKAVR